MSQMVKIGRCGDVRCTTVFPHEQTFVGTHRTSVSCHKPTHAPQQMTRMRYVIDHFVGEGDQRRPLEAKNLNSL
jgi:hypothetical protein